MLSVELGNIAGFQPVARLVPHEPPTQTLSTLYISPLFCSSPVRPSYRCNPGKAADARGIYHGKSNANGSQGANPCPLAPAVTSRASASRCYNGWPHIFLYPVTMKHTTEVSRAWEAYTATKASKLAYIAALSHVVDCFKKWGGKQINANFWKFANPAEIEGESREDYHDRTNGMQRVYKSNDSIVVSAGGFWYDRETFYLHRSGFGGLSVKELTAKVPEIIERMCKRLLMLDGQVLQMEDKEAKAKFEEIAERYLTAKEELEAASDALTSLPHEFYSVIK